MITDRQSDQERFRWGNYTLVPLLEEHTGQGSTWLGLMGFSGRDHVALDDEQEQALQLF